MLPCLLMFFILANVAVAQETSTAAKSAVEAHCRQLAIELARLVPGATVTALRPGVVDTPALRKIPGSQDWIDVVLMKHPGKRLTTPDDVGAAIVACAVALYFMEQKAHSQGLSLRRAVARRFFMTLAPAFLAGAILTAALVGRVDREIITGMWLLLYGTGLTACGLFAVPAVFTAGVAFMALGTATLWLPPGSAPIVLALGFGAIHLVMGGAIVRYHGG